ncbi:iron ABC transporter permease [Paucibacter sediminis]|uniref:Iron ABC transporter permease n=1 Tax=Paucibacter sediminis TaxID=3019553 RepID=A0AA95NID4_9BURK|nr:iron ABC transporter permease [Paucibacter sp. S2-9]WIT10121.1 iron ABC transporter permease [Paucibacter sp. S2-9]
MLRFIILVCLLLAVPVAGVLGSWLALDAQAWAILAHQWQTVLPEYAWSSLLLSVSVALGVALLGGATAAAVSLFEFPGRRWFEWALLLPMAMPAYVAAYAYTDVLQYSGALQSTLRQWTGAQGALWPDPRSLPGAVLLFVLCLYPYVYLLTRTALAERGVALMEAARMLGAGTWRRVREVALPLARPALAAGVALALMETLADYGVGAYFGLTTLTTGIYKAWLVMNDRIAAAQLASVLLLVVALLLWLERRAQARLRFVGSRSGALHAAEARPLPLQGLAALGAFLLCALPVLLGFVLPVLVLLQLLWQEGMHGEMGLPLARFAQWAWTSLQLAGLAAVLAVSLALVLAYATRVRSASPTLAALLGVSNRIVSLGYAVPGAVLAVGILLPLGWLQTHAPQLGLTALMTGSIAGLIYAYLVRFSGVALQSVEAGYARISTTVDETARMLGASRRRLFLELHAPLLARSALAAALLVFVDVMKELPATLVLRPFNSDTLAVVAYQLARDERLGEAALPSLAIVLVGLVPVLMLSRAMRKKPGT